MNKNHNETRLSGNGIKEHYKIRKPKCTSLGKNTYSANPLQAQEDGGDRKNTASSATTGVVGL